VAKVNPIQLQKALKGTKYPAQKQALLDSAKTNGADESIMAALRELPETDYNRPSDVSKHVRGDSSEGGQTAPADAAKGGTKGKSEGGTTRRASTRKATTRDTTPSQAEGDRDTVERNLRKKNLE
jgi:hypothetical protein